MGLKPSDPDHYGRNYVKGAAEDVNRPTHYNQGKIECIDFIEDQNLDYHLGNAVKYIIRCRFKGTMIKDLEKAIWYLNRRLHLEKTRPEKRPALEEKPVASAKGLTQHDLIHIADACVRAVEGVDDDEDPDKAVVSVLEVLESRLGFNVIPVREEGPAVHGNGFRPAGTLRGDA